MPIIANIAPSPKLRFFDATGIPLAGGKLFTYAAGSATKQATYTDSTAGTPNTNPILLDSQGYCSVWFDTSLSYKFTLAPANDSDPPTNPIWSVDNLGAPNALNVVAGDLSVTGNATVTGNTTINGTLTPVGNILGAIRMPTSLSVGTDLRVTAGPLTVIDPNNENLVTLDPTHAAFTSSAVFVNSTRAASGAFNFLRFQANSVDEFTARGDGMLQIAQGLGVGNASPPASGIAFPATQVAVADANTIDDYEEGTWNPITGGTATYTTQLGQYTKIGRTVYISGLLQINSQGTGSLSTISGLPFTASASGPGRWSMAVRRFAGLAGNHVFVAGFTNGGQSSVSFDEMGAAAAATTQNALILQSGAEIEFSGFYDT